MNNQEPQEDSDLLAGKSRVERNGSAMPNAEQEARDPPDGGLRAYSVVVGAFVTNGLVFGVMNSYSVIYPVIKEHLDKAGVSQSDSRAALVGSLTVGALFLLSPVSGMLTALLGLQQTAVLGGTIAATGLLLSSFATNSVNTLTFTYGIMYGLGASFAYTPSLSILGHYFKKHLGKVNGVVTVGSSVFTVFMPTLMDYMLKNYGLAALFRLLAALTTVIAFCGLLFKPISLVPKPSRETGNKSFIKSIINIEIWKNKRYKYWALSMPVALLGYFVPYVHIKMFMEELFVDVNYNLPLQCIAFTSGLGRLSFGYLADRPGVNEIMLQQISFYVIGSFTILLPFVRVFWLLIIIALIIGLCDGAFIALIGPIAFKLCGGASAPQAIGCMLGLAAIPISLGPSIAAYIYTLYNSYTLPFVLSGLTPLAGATLMFAVHYTGQGNNRGAKGPVLALPPPDIERSSVLLLKTNEKNGNANQQTSL